MLRRLAEFTARRPKLVLGVVVALLGISIVFGGAVAEKLGVGGFTDPASESAQADAFLDETFGATTNLVIQVIARNGTVDEDSDIAATAEDIERIVEEETGAKVIGSFRTDSGDDLRSSDGTSGLILVHIEGTADEAAAVASRIIDRLPTADRDVVVRAGGTLGVQDEINDRVDRDLVISEAIAVPISLAVLVIVFGGLVAACLPVAVGVTSIVTTLLVLLLMTAVTDVSVHALTVATAFGLGLSIDFGLLMVSRFREERHAGRDHRSAIVATVTSAGRTIIFSAATVTLATTSLLVFPVYFLRSVGLAASAVVILSALSAIVVLPALLALLGSRIDALVIVRRKVSLSADSTFWRGCAQAVTRRPLWYALPVVAVLVALGIPFLGVQLATPDERALPADSNARLVSESLRDDYPVDLSQAITLVAVADPDALTELVADVSRMDGVIRVDQPPTSGPSGYAFVYLSVDAQSDAAQQIVRDIRAKIADHQVEVGGPTALLIDSRDAIAERLPLAIALITVFTFVLLFLFTGSVVVPLKALVLNVLVLSAVLGTMVWVFQYGHLASALGITPAPLNLSMVVLLCAIAFSLSVDYEIFLLSRVKEARDAGMSNTDAIVVGLGRVGRIITSAALLLTITLISFANGLSFMKMFGIGTALAVVIDATVIRGVVVPAFLQVAGNLNWWAPRPLRWLHGRIGLGEAPPVPSTRPVLAGVPTPSGWPAAPVAEAVPRRRVLPATIRRDGPVVRATGHGGGPADAATDRVARPKRWLLIDDGSRLPLDRACVIGRDPHGSDAAESGLRPMHVDDHTGAMSRAHLEIRLGNDGVFVVDRSSTNGTFMRGPAHRGWVRLPAWQPTVWRPGAAIRIGSRTVRLHMTAANIPAFCARESATRHSVVGESHRRSAARGLHQLRTPPRWAATGAGEGTGEGRGISSGSSALSRPNVHAPACPGTNSGGCAL